MSELTKLAHEVRGLLSSHGVYTARSAWLAGPVTDDAVSVPLDGSSISMGEGTAEIGDEVLYVRRYDESTNSLLIAPDGRGWDGTAAAAHVTGDRVTLEPTFPISVVKRHLRDAAGRMFPRVYAVGTHEFLFKAGEDLFPLPGDVEHILDVEVEGFGAGSPWCEAGSWRFETNLPAADYPTGRGIRFAGAAPGRTVRVKYKRKPDLTVLEASNHWEDSGLSTEARHLVQVGAAATLIRFSETHRFTSPAGSSDSFEGMRPFYITSAKVADSLEQQFQIGVRDEQARLRNIHPVKIVRVR